jgi:hypothetical protein
MNPFSLNVRILSFLGVFALASFSLGWGNMGQTSSFAKSKNKLAVKVPANVLAWFFMDNYLGGGYPYAYPEKAKVTVDEKVFKNGEASLRIDLDPGAYSGGAVCFYNMTVDVKPYVAKGALEFWIKGAAGNEKAQAALVDDMSDMKKTVVRLPVDWYVKNNTQITKEWNFVSIPLKDFTKVMPSVWDSIQHLEVPNEFHWDKVAEFRIESREKENTSFRVWTDDIFIVKKRK